jgi:hypothetical protein
VLGAHRPTGVRLVPDGAPRRGADVDNLDEVSNALRLPARTIISQVLHEWPVSSSKSCDEAQARAIQNLASSLHRWSNGSTPQGIHSIKSVSKNAHSSSFRSLEEGQAMPQMNDGRFLPAMLKLMGCAAPTQPFPTVQLGLEPWSPMTKQRHGAAPRNRRVWSSKTQAVTKGAFG